MSNFDHFLSSFHSFFSFMSSHFLQLFYAFGTKKAIVPFLRMALTTHHHGILLYAEPNCMVNHTVLGTLSTCKVSLDVSKNDVALLCLLYMSSYNLYTCTSIYLCFFSYGLLKPSETEIFCSKTHIHSQNQHEIFHV